LEGILALLMPDASGERREKIFETLVQNVAYR